MDRFQTKKHCPRIMFFFFFWGGRIFDVIIIVIPDFTIGKAVVLQYFITIGSINDVSYHIMTLS